MATDVGDFDPQEEFILFSDKRQREHRRRQSVIAVDDTDVILHKRAARRSILYGGDSQGPKFWNQLKSAWKNHYVIPAPSPTSVRDIHDLSIHREQDIFNAKPDIMKQHDVMDVNASVAYFKEDACHSTAQTCKTFSTSKPAQYMESSARQFHSVWDRLDAWSMSERRRVQEYHDTVQQQNKRIAAVSTAVKEDRNEKSDAPSIPSKIQFGGRVVASATTAAPTVGPTSLRGRLRRQHSWNGRDSSRDLLQARGSIMAETDDCSFRHLLSVLDGHMDDDQEDVVVQEDGPNVPVDSTGPRSGSRSVNIKKDNMARSKADQCVMNLIM
ncbi:hypothetical protein IV203_016443 [Nitzschia inconspicua]|uniref:Uncharacterized protein n=1 Tax=Nitzschia inconspicua TaxID=303405 RepID=A0A9K3KPR8_9STRA|nr:hypothetical protein IV203_016443 [Nitzschia inconspicua]